jgi:hypothetical protein
MGKSNYWTYLRYVLKHKYFVAGECIKRGMWWHAITHDLSKFSRTEFKAYANHDFKLDYADPKFDAAWLHHQHNNKHHWDFWVSPDSGEPLFMPYKYVDQLICDWNAMSKVFGGTSFDYYCKVKDKIKMHKLSRLYLEYKLNDIGTLAVLQVKSKEILSYIPGAVEVFGVLSQNGGITILDKNNKDIGVILECFKERYQGADVYIEKIIVRNDKILSEILTSMYSGRQLIVSDTENIWG